MVDELARVARKNNLKKTSFRVADHNDAIFIARLLREFYKKQGDVYGIAWDHQSALNTIIDTIQRGVCLVGPNSCAGALLTPFPFNANCLIANVLFWYFRTPREIEILRALIHACQLTGATHINPSSHFPRNTIGKLYLRMGIRPTEVQYLAEIDCCKLEEKG